MLRTLPSGAGSPVDARSGTALSSGTTAGRCPRHLSGPTQPNARRRGHRTQEETRRTELGGNESAGQTHSRQERTRQVNLLLRSRSIASLNYTKSGLFRNFWGGEDL